jgi:hypothetical protein
MLNWLSDIQPGLTSPPIKRVNLKAKHYSVQQEIERWLRPMSAAQFTQRAGIERDTLINRLSCYIASETKDKQYKHPADWKQALKQSFYAWLNRKPFIFNNDPFNRLSKRLQSRFPVVNTVLSVQADILYPEISLPKDRHWVSVLKMDTTCQPVE